MAATARNPTISLAPTVQRENTCIFIPRFFYDACTHGRSRTSATQAGPRERQLSQKVTLMKLTSVFMELSISIVLCFQTGRIESLRDTSDYQCPRLARA